MRLYSYAPAGATPFQRVDPGQDPGDEAAAKRVVHRRPADADAIVVMAHRDDSGLGAGANDNASGTAALIELARGYGRPPGRPAADLGPEAHTLLFLSTDGGAFGGLGAARFIDRLPDKNRIVAVVNLDSIAGKGKPRVEIGGDQPRSPAAALVETAAARIAEQTGSGPGRTSALGQLTDLGFPFSLYEQAPLVGKGMPAITLTTGGDRPPASFGDTPERLHRKHLTDIGRAAQTLVGSIDEFGLVSGSRSYVYLGQRLVRGWAIELALVAMLLPFVVVAVDLFARCRRRRIPVAPGPARLPQPARLLALGRADLPVPRLRRRLAGRRRAAPRPRDERGDALAAARARAVRPPRRARLARRACPPRPEETGDRGGGDRRPHRDDARARRRRPAGRGDEPVRAPVPAAVPAHLALAPAHARAAGRRHGSHCSQPA